MDCVIYCLRGRGLDFKCHIRALLALHPRLRNESVIRLSLGSLKDADLSAANLVNANLKGSYLRGASLVNAYLEDADLGFANLKDVSLYKTDMSGADPGSAIVMDIIPCNTTRPDGSINDSGC